MTLSPEIVYVHPGSGTDPIADERGEAAGGFGEDVTIPAAEDEAATQFGEPRFSEICDPDMALGVLADESPVALSRPAASVELDRSQTLDWVNALMGPAMLVMFLVGLVWTSIAWNRNANDSPFAGPPSSFAANRQSVTQNAGVPQPRTIPIEKVRVGMRVPAHNPQLSDADRTAAAFDVDPKGWRTIRLEVEKESGGKLDVTLLRPVDWLVEQVVATELLLAAAETELIDERTWVSKLAAALRWNPLAELADSTSAIFHNSPVQDIGSLASFSSLPLVIANELGARLGAAAVADVQVTESLSEIRNSLLSGEATGTVVYLDMPELGAQGIATILAIEPCPRITKGPGQIVTATFKHSAADVLDLTFSPSIPSASSSGLPTPASNLTLGVTASHPFWSVNHKEFIPAGALELGDQVVGIDGQFFRLTSTVPRAGPENVYNFEVAIDHVYFVGSSGVLVHNACPKQVYFLMKNGKVVYVGISRHPAIRKAAHKLRGKDFDTMAVITKPLADAHARELESRLIRQLVNRAIQEGKTNALAKVEDQLVAAGVTVHGPVHELLRSCGFDVELRR